MTSILGVQILLPISSCNYKSILLTCRSSFQADSAYAGWAKKKKKEKKIRYQNLSCLTQHIKYQQKSWYENYVVVQVFPYCVTRRRTIHSICFLLRISIRLDIGSYICGQFGHGSIDRVRHDHSYRRRHLKTTRPPRFLNFSSAARVTWRNGTIFIYIQQIHQPNQLTFRIFTCGGRCMYLSFSSVSCAHSTSLSLSYIKNFIGGRMEDV